MPYYIYEHPETKERVELLQSAHDEHSYTFAGIKWDRVWTLPQLSMDTKIDPFSMNKFMDKTSTAGSLGDIWDRAAEMSEARAEKTGGIDPVKEKFTKETGKTLPKKRSKNVNIEIG